MVKKLPRTNTLAYSSRTDSEMAKKRSYRILTRTDSRSESDGDGVWFISDDPCEEDDPTSNWERRGGR